MERTAAPFSGAAVILAGVTGTRTGVGTRTGCSSTEDAGLARVAAAAAGGPWAEKSALSLASAVQTLSSSALVQR